VTPIDEVRPTRPYNWTRRPESRKKRGGPEPARERARERRDDNGPGSGLGRDPDDREHIVDELA
jgi:hypothetical protein